MALNIKVILEQTGETKEEFAEAIGISVDELDLYIKGDEKPNIGLYGKITEYTGLTLEQIELGKRNISNIQFYVDDTWSPSQEAKNDLVQYLTEGLEKFDDELVKQEIEKINKCIKEWRKPRISVAGQSDTGKSTLINALIGSEKMPAKWTPTTSIVVYIKHVNDRPEYIEDDVWIFGKKDNQLWDDSKLQDENYSKEFYLAGGDYSILETYGTHQSGMTEAKEAFSAVAFVDSELLKDCDILDIPGFAASDEDDALHRFGTQNTDILIYLSRSNGFLQDGDLNYLNLCLNSLRPFEKNENRVEKLENLFIVAAQAGAVNNGNVSELNEIMDTQCKKMCKILRSAVENCSDNNEVMTLLPRRTAITGYDYNEEDFGKRFFTYEKNMPRLCKKFHKAFTELIEKLPISIHKDFVKDLNAMAEESKTSIRKRVKEYNEMMIKKEEYKKLVKEIKAKEPARIAEQNAKNEELLRNIDNLNIESKQEIQKFYYEFLCEENLMKEMEKNDCRNKKSDRQDFIALVGKVMSEKSQSIMEKKTNEYTELLNEYLEQYNSTLNKYGAVDNIKVDFDAMKVFALGISALGVLGASAAWLATSFTATIVTLFPELAGMGMFAAFGGVVVIAIAAVVAGIVAIVKATTWKKSFAKSIIDAYEKNNYLEKMYEKIEQYWADTKVGVKVGAKKIESEWASKIKEYESLGDEKGLKKLGEKLAQAKMGLDFFEQMPLPKPQ